MMQFLFLFLICVFCNGCQKSYVTVVQEKIHRKYLASSFVDSPDPLQQELPHGRKLYISWNIGSAYQFTDCQIRISMIFRNRNTRTIDLVLPKKRGTLVYSLLGQDYYETEGLLTYKIELVTKTGEFLAEWRHQMWINMITLDKSQSQEKAKIIERFTK